MLSVRLTIALGVLAATGWAQPSTGVAGPVTGYIFDSHAGAVRPMLGIPGPAYLGNALAAGFHTASVAPDGSAALAVQERGGKLLFYSGFQTAKPVTSVVPGSLTGADRFAWSADSGSAAIYSSATGKGQILTGLAKAPSISAPIDLSSLPGPVTALAFDGSLLIAAVSGDSGGLYAASATAPPQRIAAALNPSAIALAGKSLYFADSQAQQIFQVQNYAGTAATVIFASDASIDSPVGLELSVDGRRLYVANAGNQQLVAYDIASRGPMQNLPLPFTPTRLDRFGDPAVFVMNGTGAGPLYVMRDGGPGKAAIYFVPSPAGKPRSLRPPVRPAS